MIGPKAVRWYIHFEERREALRTQKGLITPPLIHWVYVHTRVRPIRGLKRTDEWFAGHIVVMLNPRVVKKRRGKARKGTTGVAKNSNVPQINQEQCCNTYLTQTDSEVEHNIILQKRTVSTPTPDYAHLFHESSTKLVQYKNKLFLYSSPLPTWMLFSRFARRPNRGHVQPIVHNIRSIISSTRSRYRYYIGQHTAICTEQWLAKTRWLMIGRLERHGRDWSNQRGGLQARRYKKNELEEYVFARVQKTWRYRMGVSSWARV